VVVFFFGVFLCFLLFWVFIYENLWFFAKIVEFLLY